MDNGPLRETETIFKSLPSLPNIRFYSCRNFIILKDTSKIRTVTFHPIKTKKDYQNALSGLEKIFDAEPRSSEGDELEALGILIDAYEKEHHPIDIPTALSLGEKSGMKKNFDPKKNLQKLHKILL